MKQSEQIEKLITANGGMIQTSQITDVGISKTALYQYVKANEIIKLKVPVTFEGQGALETNRLVLETFASEIEVQGAVEKLPEKIEIDVSNKKFEDKILAKDITLPEGVHLVTAEDTLLALVAGTEGEPEEEEAETDEKTE